MASKRSKDRSCASSCEATARVAGFGAWPALIRHAIEYIAGSPRECWPRSTFYWKYAVIEYLLMLMLFGAIP
jgi:hypothetical protein